jgi:hypothetical protein
VIWYVLNCKFVFLFVMCLRHVSYSVQIAFMNILKRRCICIRSYTWMKIHSRYLSNNLIKISEIFRCFCSSSKLGWSTSIYISTLNALKINDKIFPVTSFIEDIQSISTHVIWQYVLSFSVTYLGNVYDLYWIPCCSA